MLSSALTDSSLCFLSAGSGEGCGKIIQRFPKKDWEGTAFPQGVEMVSDNSLLLCKLKITQTEQSNSMLPGYFMYKGAHGLKKEACWDAGLILIPGKSFINQEHVTVLKFDVTVFGDKPQTIYPSVSVLLLHMYVVHYKHLIKKIEKFILLLFCMICWLVEIS